MQVAAQQIKLTKQTGYRLIHSKFPPIALFDDVADASEFESLYQLQALTNPRLSDQVGNVSLLDKSEFPFGIQGCSYAVAPFTHINPDGSRFMSGQRGMLYLADSFETAISESLYHQQKYFNNLNLHYDRIVMRGLICRFSGDFLDISKLAADHPIYSPDDYSAAREFAKPWCKKVSGLQYLSVRRPEHICWGLFTPKEVLSIKQSCHYEFIFDTQTISQVNLLTQVNTAP